MLKMLRNLWQHCSHATEIAYVCRFAILVNCAVAFIFCLAQQGQDVLRGIAEDSARKFGALSLAAILCGLASWYWPRILLYLDSHTFVRNSRTETWLPRMLGASTFWILALACLMAREHLKADFWLEVYGAIFIAMGIVMILGLMFRRFLLNKRGIAKPVATKLRQMPGSSWYILAGTIVSSVILIVLFWQWPVLWGARFNSAAVVLCAGASWISVGSFLVYLSQRSRLPLIGVIVVMTMACGFLFEYYGVRVDENGMQETQNLDVQFNAWLKMRQSPDSTVTPVVLVAAEGGGIRAAYWTAQVLSALDSADNRFGHHLFAISGVSGGSLGAAVYASMTAHRAKFMKKSRSFGVTADTILGHDFLTPTIGSMLYPEVFQAPIGGILGADRGTVIEQAWEEAWNAEVGGDRTFSESFMNLWRERPLDVPSLLLNGTSVEHGNRLIMSNITIDHSIFHDATDIHALTRLGYKVSTAVTMSARFTYVSPAGLLKKVDCEKEHVVDGGYFDNSGAETITDLIEHVMQDSIRAKTIRFVVVMITNEPEDKSGVDAHHSCVGFTQTMAPLTALMSARESHAEYSREALRKLVHPENFIEFGLKKRDVALPLGWQLSDAARREMREQLYGLKDSIKVVKERIASRK